MPGYIPTFYAAFIIRLEIITELLKATIRLTLLFIKGKIIAQNFVNI